MRILELNLKQGFVKLLPQNMEDLIDIYKIVEPNDIVSGLTTRKIKIGDDNEKQIKKSLFAKIELEKKELNEDSLRLLGKIVSEHEDIPVGSYHSLTIIPNKELGIKKRHWKNFQIERLKKTEQRTEYKALALVFDREDATIALITNKGYSIIDELKGDVAKKDALEEKENFYKTIASFLEKKVEEIKPDNIICASPGFYNDELKKELESKAFFSKVIFAHAFNPGERGIAELLKRSEIQEVIKEQRLMQENELVQSLLLNISKGEKAAYGLQEVYEKAQLGAIEKLIINEDMLFSDESSSVEELINLVEGMKGEAHIIECEEPKRILRSLGGIGAILRF